MRINNRDFKMDGNTYVMGILNVIPDSSSDGGRYFNNLDAALFHVSEMIQEGADIIDVGGEPTNSGSRVVSEEEELERVVPAIEGIRERFDIPITLDTYRSKVAEAGIQAGAGMINDTRGLKGDPKMAGVIAAHHVACSLIHNRPKAEYKDFKTELLSDLQESVDLALAAGIPENKIILNPGIDFAKNYEQNLDILAHLDELVKLKYPILLSTSRKSVVRYTLDASATESMAGTLATTVLAVEAGCTFVRVHDVKENVDAIRMTRAVLAKRD